MKIFDREGRVVGRLVSIGELKALDAYEIREAFVASKCCFICRTNGTYAVLKLDGHYQTGE